LFYYSETLTDSPLAADEQAFARPLEGCCHRRKTHQSPGKSPVEFTYLSVRMRKITIDQDVAIKTLGPDLAQSFRSLIADMREAMFLGELADLPEIIGQHDSVKLRFVIESNAWLEVEPVGRGSMANGQWRQSHRVKLLHIYRSGIVSI
jgi:hypothetical protein